MKQGFFRIGRRRERDRESWGILPGGARFTFFSCFHFEDALSYHPRGGLRMTSFQSAFLARSFNFDTRGNITYIADTWWRLKSTSVKEKGGKFLHLCLCVLVPLSFFFPSHFIISCISSLCGGDFSSRFPNESRIEKGRESRIRGRDAKANVLTKRYVSLGTNGRCIYEI